MVIGIRYITTSKLLEKIPESDFGSGKYIIYLIT